MKEKLKGSALSAFELRFFFRLNSLGEGEGGFLRAPSQPACYLSSTRARQRGYSSWSFVVGQPAHDTLVVTVGLTSCLDASLFRTPSALELVAGVGVGARSRFMGYKNSGCVRPRVASSACRTIVKMYILLGWGIEYCFFCSGCGHCQGRLGFQLCGFRGVQTPRQRRVRITPLQDPTGSGVFVSPLASP